MQANLIAIVPATDRTSARGLTRGSPSPTELQDTAPPLLNGGFPESMIVPTQSDCCHFDLTPAMK